MKARDNAVILLCGIPGSGKTEAGAKLASKLDVPFVDLDEYITDKSGMDIGEIFSTLGVEKFREKEADALGALFKDGCPRVLALGGGSLEHEKARQLLDEYPSLLVWLRADPREAARRLETAGLVDDRPLLSGLYGEALIEGLSIILARREIFYSDADIVIDTDRLSPDEIAAEIIVRIGELKIEG